MNIQNLTEGMVIKNYKELCRLLEMKFYTGGNAKASQMKELERFVIYEKEGNKFMIKKIKENPSEKIDLRKEGRASVYSQDIQRLILDMLAKSEEYKISLSINMLLKELQMVNKNYSVGKFNTLELARVLKVNESVVQDVYNDSHQKLKDIIVNALNKLQDKALIIWNTSTWVAIEDVSIEMNELNKPKLIEGRICYNTNTVYREATDDEIHMILKIQGELLDEYNCKTLTDIMVRGLCKGFFRDLNKRLQTKANILFSYQCYNIIQNNERVQDEVLGRFEKVEIYNRLNNNIVNSAKESVERKHSNSKEKLKWGDTNIWTEEKHNLRASEEYPVQAKKVSEKILDRQSRDIRGKIINEKEK